MEKNVDMRSDNTSKPPAKKTPSLTTGTLFVVVIIAVIFSSLFGAIFGFLAASVDKRDVMSLLEKNKIPLAFDQKEKNTVSIVEPPKTFMDEEETIIQVVENATEAVVSIVVTKDVPIFRNFYGSPFDFFFDPFGGREPEQNGTQRQEVGGGTGFFISQDGMIVTNKHVVAEEDAQYTVITQDGTEYEAYVMARDPMRDIAVIKIEGENFPMLELGNSDDIKVGQTVIAIGNSLGEFSNSVSRGIVSGLQRDVVAGSSFGRSERLTNIIQTDAAINPGNSGGPLLDIHGRVVGVNTAVARGAENVGFALPINPIKNTLEQVRTEGKISVPYIGVRYLIINEAIARENNLDFEHGALVIRGQNITDLAVVPGSPADKAGIVENDIILEIEGEKIDEDNQLSQAINQYSVGETITMKVWHKGEEKEVALTLEERE
jgi:S1-C subfamily serine protease